MRLFVWDRFSLFTAGMIGAFVLFLAFGAPRTAETMAQNTQEIPIYSVETDKKEIAVTFDVAWEPGDLDEILSILREYRAEATFFAVGDWVVKYPEETKKIHAAGYTLASHSMHHTLYTKLSPEEMAADMDAVDQILTETVGEAPPVIRVPSGDYNASVVRTVRASGREIIEWDCDSLDWKDLSAKEIKERILEKAGNGSILLFHVGTAHTAEALPGILSALQEEGYTFPKVEDMIYDPPYTLDHAGRQRKDSE